MRTFKFKLDVSESLDLLKAAGVKKLWLRAGYSYAGLSERRLVEITSDNKKYLNLMRSLINNGVPNSVKAESVMNIFI